MVCGFFFFFFVCGERFWELNPGPLTCQSCAMPLSCHSAPGWIFIYINLGSQPGSFLPLSYFSASYIVGFYLSKVYPGIEPWKDFFSSFVQQHQVLLCVNFPLVSLLGINVQVFGFMCVCNYCFVVYSFFIPFTLLVLGSDPVTVRVVTINSV